MTDRELLELLVSKFDSMENRMGTMESRFDSMESRFEARFDAMDTRFDDMEGKNGSVEGKIGSIEGKIGSMEGKIGSIETDIKDMKIDVIGVKDQTSILIEFREETKNHFYALEQKLDEIEAKNAERHVLINSNVISIKQDLSRVEVNTAENWVDIARIKAMK